MGTAEKTLDKMRRNTKNWRIEDIEVVAHKYNLRVRSEGGSHHVFSYPGVRERVSVPAHRPIKPVYIKLFVELIDKVRGEK